VTLLSPGFARTSNIDLIVSVLASPRHDTGSVSVACHKVLLWDQYSFQFIPHQSVLLLQILGFLSNSMLTFQRPLMTWLFTSILLNPAFMSLHSWLCQNGLALNIGKSESILFSTPSRSRNFSSVPDVNIAGIPVHNSDKIVTLGVTLDRHLALSHHTSNVRRDAYFRIRALPTSDLYLLKIWLSQWLSQWFTHV